MIYVEPKADGWWVRVEISGGEYRLFTRSGQEVESGVCPAPDGVLYAEWMHGTQWSRRDPGALYVFDFEGRGGYGDRRRAYRQWWRAGGRAWKKLRHMPTAASTPASRKNREAASWKKYVERDGWEGLVFKSDGTKPGKLDNKRKRVATWDFVVSAVHLGSSGSVASLGLREWREGALADCGRVAHLPEPVKTLASRSPERVIGQVVEVRGQERTEAGAVRHPRFVRFRWDKPASQCVSLIATAPQLADFFATLRRWTGLCWHPS